MSQRNTHQCWFDDCDREVPRDMLMCRAHWFAVPKPIRDEVWRAYRNHGPLTPQWWEAVEAANDSLKAEA